MTTPPAYLLHDFDPRAVKVADLRGILLAHDVSARSGHTCRLPPWDIADPPPFVFPPPRGSTLVADSVRFERQEVGLGRRV